MIHAHIDSLTTKNIIGFEVGTRAGFDDRHGGDPLWVFLDYATVEFEMRTQEFFLDPKSFYIDKHGIVQKHVSTPSVFLYTL